MTVSQIMERAGIKETGRAISYIKEALSEMAIQTPTHTRTSRIDIDANKRFYALPNESEEILDIRCLNHNNNNSEYKSIPRSIYEPSTKDTDGI